MVCASVLPMIAIAPWVATLSDHEKLTEAELLRAWMAASIIVLTFTCVSVSVKLVATSAGANITSIKVSAGVVATSVVAEALIYI